MNGPCGLTKHTHYEEIRIIQENEGRTRAGSKSLVMPTKNTFTLTTENTVSSLYDFPVGGS